MIDTDSETAPVFLKSLQSDAFERQFGPEAALALLLVLPPLALGLLCGVPSCTGSPSASARSAADQPLREARLIALGRSDSNMATSMA